MTDINVGEVSLTNGKYEVILRRIGANVGKSIGGGSDNTSTLPPLSQEGGKKAKKEKKKGTRKLNPYMAFAKKARQEVLAEYPELKPDVVGVGRKIGEKWRALSDAEKAKY